MIRMRDMIEQAISLGMDEICITEHLEFDESMQLNAPLNMRAYYEDALVCRDAYREKITLRIGAEVGLKDDASHAATQAALEGLEMDFIIGSVHNTRDGNPFIPGYYRDVRNVEEAYGRYFLEALERLQASDGYCVMGHYDYLAKNMPFPERAPRYEYCPEALDAVFRYIISKGVGVEINTSAWLSEEGAVWGKDILTRYRELGGEFVTIGSDAHISSRIGRRFFDALDLARTARIPYLATFHRMQPIMHKI